MLEAIITLYFIIALICTLGVVTNIIKEKYQKEIEEVKKGVVIEEYLESNIELNDATYCVIAILFCIMWPILFYYIWKGINKDENIK